MSNETVTTGPIGWFGKLPALGDFLRHDLPDRFVEPWDAWLQKGINAIAASHGEEGKQHLLSFPVWYFLRSLSLDQEGESTRQSLWCGLLVPSADRVGRLFPFTAAFEVPGQVFMQISFPVIEDRLNAMATAILQVLGNDDVPAFEEGMNTLQPLTVNNFAYSSETQELASPDRLIDSLGKQALLERLESHALFWNADLPLQQGLCMFPEPLQAKDFCQLALPFFINSLSE